MNCMITKPLSITALASEGETENLTADDGAHEPAFTPSANVCRRRSTERTEEESSFSDSAKEEEFSR